MTTPSLHEAALFVSRVKIDTMQLPTEFVPFRNLNEMQFCDSDAADSPCCRESLVSS